MDVPSRRGYVRLTPEVEQTVRASGIRTRPLKQARDWGYQRLVAGKVVLLADAAPPPIARVTEAGCASTLAFELSDGDERIVVNCGGAALTGATIPADLARGLRTIERPAQSVRNEPGATAVTRIPSAATSLPSTSLIPSKANLLPQ